MKTLSRDARGFVDEVTSYIKHDGTHKSVLPKVEDLLQKVTAQTKREKSARVITAVILSVEEKNRIVTWLEKLLGHEVTLELEINKELLGGIRIQVGDWVVDTSLRETLSQMARSIK